MNTTRTAAYFVSDAHLGARYIVGARAHEERLVSLLQSMEADAEAVFLVGDILDFWFEYRHVVPKGFTRLFGQLARMTDAGIRVFWFRGNHDMWTYTYLQEELGVTVVDEQLETDIFGRRFFISHGDNLGPQPRSYRLMRAIFRSPFWQAVGRAFHPSWLMSFGFAWSSHNRLRRQQQGPEESVTVQPDNTYSTAPQMLFAEEYARRHPDIDFFVTGHSHCAVMEPVPGSDHATFICLGDFFRLFTYGRFTADSGFSLLKAT